MYVYVRAWGVRVTIVAMEAQRFVMYCWPTRHWQYKHTELHNNAFMVNLCRRQQWDVLGCSRTNFHSSSQYQISQKSVQWGVALIHADTRTDTTKVTDPFREHANTTRWRDFQKMNPMSVCWNDRGVWVCVRSQIGSEHTLSLVK